MKDEIYNEKYYGDYAASGKHYRDIPEVRDTLIGLAYTLDRTIEFDKVLDVGCAFGYLVEAFFNMGKLAYGIDISHYAISELDDYMYQWISYGDVSQNRIIDKYDLVTCVEVLEHIAPEREEYAIWNLTQASSKYIYFSSENNPNEITHINIHPRHYWVAAFERFGFTPIKFFYPYIPHGLLLQKVE